MADVLPINFPSPQEQVIASYNFIDVINNLGYLDLYLAAVEATGTTYEYILTTNSAFKSTNDKRNHQGGTMDLDFDISVNKTITIAPGYAFGTVSVDGGDDNDSVTLTMTLIKFDGVTETTIAQEVITANIGTSPNRAKYLSFRMLCTQTNLAKGDTLRLNGTYTGGQASYTFRFDPSGRNSITEVGGATIGGDSSISVPIKLDL